MNLQRYYMGYNGFDECVDEIAADFGKWVDGDESKAALNAQALLMAEKDARIKELEKALRVCHGRHGFPVQCAELVDMYFHKLYPREYNPHTKTLEEKK
jgi:hypothetical protein